jgi:hypothetical protein
LKLIEYFTGKSDTQRIRESAKKKRFRSGNWTLSVYKVSRDSRFHFLFPFRCIGPLYTRIRLLRTYIRDSNICDSLHVHARITQAFTALQ